MSHAAALAGATAISFSAIFFDLADVTPVTGAFWRAAYALPVLFALSLAGRAGDRRSRRERSMALLAGVLLGIDVVAWHASIDHIGAGLATLLANSQVVIVAFLAWLILGERPARAVVLAVPVVLVGVTLVSGLGRDDAFGENPVLGTILAMVAAAFYACFLLLFRQSNRRKVSPARPLLEATTGYAASALVIGLVGPGVDMAPEWPSHGWLVALALLAQVLGWLLIGYALPRLPAAETSTVILLQPVLTMTWGALLLAERPSGLQLAGAAIVLAGVGTVVRASVTRRRIPVEV